MFFAWVLQNKQVYWCVCRVGLKMSTGCGLVSGDRTRRPEMERLSLSWVPTQHRQELFPSTVTLLCSIPHRNFSPHLGIIINSKVHNSTTQVESSSLLSVWNSLHTSSPSLPTPTSFSLPQLTSLPAGRSAAVVPGPTSEFLCPVWSDEWLSWLWHVVASVDESFTLGALAGSCPYSYSCWS